MMRKISAQYLFTSAGKPLRRGIVTAGNDGTIISVEDTGGNPDDSAATEFYNGIIIPGLVNCHSHLELSHMRSVIPEGGGLQEFITAVRSRREASPELIAVAAEQADREMYDGGVAACGDISNNTLSLDVKHKSHIRYLTFTEVFGTNPDVAADRMREAQKVTDMAREAQLPSQITPHAVYSVSENLSVLIRKHISRDSVISLHFLESSDERKMVQNHLEAALELSRIAGHLILVHNTVITRAEAETLASAGNTWFCLCPSSNMYINGAMPPVMIIRECTDRIIVGTDSLASNSQLNMISELRLLHDASPDTHLDEVIRWGTINGARALKMSDTLGSLEPGKKPGLLLVAPVDLVNLRLLPESRVRRLL